MNIGFYFIKSDFFRLVNSGLEWMDSTTNKHMYFVLPLKNELWAIPLSSQYNKYKNWYNEAKQLNKKNRFLIFVNVMNRDGVLLIQNAFPITKTFIDREAFDKHNNHLTLSSDLIQFVEKRLKLMNTYEEKGIRKKVIISIGEKINVSEIYKEKLLETKEKEKSEKYVNELLKKEIIGLVENNIYEGIK